MLGILGGMGPLATADFMQKIIARTPAENDQQHLPMLVYNVPQVPDRTEAILYGGADPLPAMLTGIAFLNRNGASLIAIPCNTAHHWYGELSRASRSPILHLADAAVAWMAHDKIDSGRVGLLATSGTVASGFYQRRLADNGFTCSVPADQSAVMDGIRLVKKNRIEQASTLIASVADALLEDGCRCIVLGCTEVPIALRGYQNSSRLIDATDALAQGCVDAFRNSDKAESIRPANARVLSDHAPAGPTTVAGSP
ncbi:MAG TPA: amino acid racemase [Lacipirellulaceae bacterium]|nr:amino acid racemase [Lacipirellulaceae bacterium]